jgi:hypothetical protein
MPNLRSTGILGDRASNEFVNVWDGHFGYAGSGYNSYLESFQHHTIADNADLINMGWAYATRNTPTATSLSLSRTNGYLLANAGTNADSGISFHTGGTPQAGVDVATTELASPVVNALGGVVSTTTLMDNREIYFQTRIGVLQSESDVWDSKFALGWTVDDLALMNTATGALDIATGGGFGFHFPESGNITAFYQPTTVGTVQSVDLNQDVSLSAADTFTWYTLGCKASWTDASAGEGSMEWYLNGDQVLRVADSLPMQSTQTYSMCFDVLNGPATVQDLDIAIDYLATGITAPGLTAGQIRQGPNRP